MRVAVWHNLPSGGGKRALYHQVKGLVERGHDVEAWCPPTADTGYLPLSSLVTEHVVPLVRSSVRTRFRSLQGIAALRTTMVQLRGMDEHCRTCGEQINAREFDVLFAAPCAFYGAAPIATYVQIPSVIYLQEPKRSLYEASPSLVWAAPAHNGRRWYSPRRLQALLNDQFYVYSLRLKVRQEATNAREFDRILVNSFFSRESVLRAYGIESEVCYLGIDTELFEPWNGAKEHFVVGVGTVYRGKGLERVIRALAAIPPEKRPPLVWIGNVVDEGYHRLMQTLANDLGVSVSFRIRVQDFELVKILGRAGAMLYAPILEPFGLAPLEANACGTPVVGLAEGGVRETIKEGINGFLASGSAAEQLAAPLIRLLEDQELAEAMSRSAREYVRQHWCWTKSIDELELHLRRVACIGGTQRIDGRVQ